MTGRSKSSICPHRWLFLRLKRILPLFAFLLIVVILTCAALVFLNSESVSAALRLASPGARGMSAGGSRHVGDPMVQFYPDNQNKMLYRKSPVSSQERNIDNAASRGARTSVIEEKLSAVKDKIGVPKNRIDAEHLDGKNSSILSYNVHLFYYAWYGTPKFDDKYLHWNHPYLKNWDKRDRRKYPQGSHDPINNDVGSNFFPQCGIYSSRDPAIIQQHMQQARLSGAGTLVLSWYPPGMADENGGDNQDLVSVLLDEAQSYGLKIAFLIEPYANLTVTNLRRNLRFIQETYSKHPAFYRRRSAAHGDRRLLPVYYLYDSYRVLPDQWSRLLSKQGDISVRGTELDGVFLALLVDFKHRADIKRAQFDGFFTYFAANGFSHGSSWKNWKSLASFAKRNSLLFVPSVGPGYVDTRIRPWNGQSTRDRRRGSYYGLAWRTALGADAKTVSVTSFNEWHEGTQIEPAEPATTRDKNFTYLSYEPEQPDFYLRETRHWIMKMVDSGKMASR